MGLFKCYVTPDRGRPKYYSDVIRWEEGGIGGIAKSSVPQLTNEVYLMVQIKIKNGFRMDIHKEIRC